MKHLPLVVLLLAACGGDEPSATGSDEECTSAGCADLDADGTPAKDDCDDAPATGGSCSQGCTDFFADADHDGRGAGSAVVACAAPPDHVADGSDCDDASGIHWADCGACADADGDGHGDGCDLGADCDDSLDTGATCSTGCTARYRDRDHDGVGDGAVSSRCPGSSEYVDVAGDCDDSMSTGADCISNCVELYVDADGDGYGRAGSVERCALVEGFTETPGDCDDSPEGDDCFDSCEVFYADEDDDGRGDAASPPLCEAPNGFVAAGGDCAPGDPLHWDDCAACLDDDDGDGRGSDCNYDDCDDDDGDNWRSCRSCVDQDADGYFAGCDAFAEHDGPDCDDLDPTMHPSAIDFPDSGAYEDCVAPEPLAASGSGIYVDGGAPACSGGGTQDGTKAAPFCTLDQGLAAADPGDSIFMAEGLYASPPSLTSVRVFGGYDPVDWSRHLVDHATTLSSSSDQGCILWETLLQGVTFAHSSVADTSRALSIGPGNPSTLVDVFIEQASSSDVCQAIQAGGGDATLVRVSNSGTYCDTEFGLYVTAGSEVSVWWSTLRAGAEGATTGDHIAVICYGGCRVGHSSLVGEGASASGVAVAGEAELLAIDVTAIGATSYGVVVDGTSCTLENSRVETHGTAYNRAFWTASGTSVLRHNVLLPAGGDLPVAYYGSDGTSAALYNNILHAGVTDLFDAAAVYLESSAGADVWLFGNSLSSAGGGFCAVANDELECVTAFSAADPAVNDCDWGGCNEAGDNFGDDCEADADGRIAADSACVDAGSEVSAVPPYDFEGHDRPQDDAPDVGRDEVQ